MKETYQYRIVWKRNGLPEKRKRYETFFGAYNRFKLLGPEPWSAINRHPDELYCCDGNFCSCQGYTVRERMLEDRATFPPIECLRIEKRKVFIGDWEVQE